MGARTRRQLGALIAVAWVASACASPVGVSRASTGEVHRYLTQSALTSDRPTPFSLIMLRQMELLGPFGSDPDAALAQLHARAVDDGLPPDELFALAELSYLRAEQTGDRSRYAAAVIYAYAFLFPEVPRPALDPLDPRSRIAADLYNSALTSAFQREPDGKLAVQTNGGVPLPFGHFTGRGAQLPELGGYEISTLQPTSELVVSGLRNRYRRAGIGMPVAAALRPTPESQVQPVPLGAGVRVPLTAVVRIDTPLAALRTGEVTGQLELIPSLERDEVEVGGQQVALEAEPTAALALGLTESRFWKKELTRFLGDALGVRAESGLFELRPYRTGRIPVVFVHGTNSSPGRWADMVNDLLADARLRRDYAFWFFSYDSGNPIAYSAWQLRDGLSRAVLRADPSGQDPCVQDMVVLGHSQGGLLTKLTAVDSGDVFWRRISDRPLADSSFSAEDKQLLQNALFVKPLPFVRSVIFLATPHRGSYLAGPQLVRRLAERLVRLPSDLVRLGGSLAAVSTGGSLTGERIPTSIDNMSPGNSFIQALAALPVAPGVDAHSIISVDSDAPLSEAGDGVVKYESAHLEGVSSELVVRAKHSGMQAAPATVEEVRRILLEHLAASSCPAPADAGATR